jgi:hypothetical protein
MLDMIHSVVKDYVGIALPSAAVAKPSAQGAVPWFTQQGLFSVTRTFGSRNQANDEFSNLGYRVVSVWQRDLDANGAEIRVIARVVSMNGGSHSFLNCVLDLVNCVRSEGSQGLLTPTNEVHSVAIPVVAPASTEFWIVGPGMRAGLPLPRSIRASPRTHNLASTLWFYLVQPAVSGVVGDIVSDATQRSVVAAASSLGSIRDLADAFESGNPGQIASKALAASLDMADLAEAKIGISIPHVGLILGATDILVFVADWAQEDRVSKIEGIPPASARILRQSGNSQTALAGDVLGTPLVVRLRDAITNDPASGVDVYFTTLDGGRFVASPSVSSAAAGNPARTDAQGYASVYWALGNKSGNQTATATSPWVSRSPVHFTATANTGTQFGQLANTVTGLPDGLDPSLSVTGPNRYSQVVSSARTTLTLSPGTYTIDAAAVSASTLECGPSPASQRKAVATSGIARVSIAYVCMGGTPPTLGGVSPASYPANNNNQTMLLNGSNFQSGATLLFTPAHGSQIPSTASKLTFVNSSQLSYQFNNQSDAGTWSVKVINPDGKNSATVSFTVTAVAPTITSVSPDSPVATGTAQTFAINGTNFASGANVTLRDLTTGELFANRQIRSLTSTQIVITPNFGTATTKHTWSVQVTNTNGQASNTFTITVRP